MSVLDPDGESARRSRAMIKVALAFFEDRDQRVADPTRNGAASHAPTMDGGGRKRFATRLSKPTRKRRLPNLVEEKFSDEAQEPWRHQRSAAVRCCVFRRRQIVAIFLSRTVQSISPLASRRRLVRQPRRRGAGSLRPRSPAIRAPSAAVRSTGRHSHGAGDDKNGGCLKSARRRSRRSDAAQSDQAAACFSIATDATVFKICEAIW